jgi:hypothetical protein
MNETGMINHDKGFKCLPAYHAQQQQRGQPSEQPREQEREQQQFQ